jgi:hypothetical protein
MSASGQYQTYVEGNTPPYITANGNIYTSSNYGNSFTQCAGLTGNWLSIAISASGQYQIATSYSTPNPGIYISNTYGTSWTVVGSTISLLSLSASSISATGKYQSAVNSNGSLYISSTYGSSFNPVTTTFIGLHDVAVSASGQFISVACGNNGVYISWDFGNTWSQRNLGGNSTISVAMSSSGQYQTSVTNGSGYISNDYGNTWNVNANTNNGLDVAISSSGQYQIVIQVQQLIYSNDYGNSWTILYNQPSILLLSIALSASGQLFSCSIFIVIPFLGYEIDIVFSGTNPTPPAKSFVIDHPLDYTKHLVHVCLEGPETGVYYRGCGEITNDTSVEIVLPDYVCDIATNFTVQICDIYDGLKPKIYSAGEIISNRFMVYGENGRFSWEVRGSRGDIVVEPYKNEIVVYGEGPYKWYS